MAPCHDLLFAVADTVQKRRTGPPPSPGRVRRRHRRRQPTESGPENRPTWFLRPGLLPFFHWTRPAIPSSSTVAVDRRRRIRVRSAGPERTGPEQVRARARQRSYTVARPAPTSPPPFRSSAGLARTRTDRTSSMDHSCS